MPEAEATEEALDVVRPNKEESHNENEDSENEGCSIMEREKVTASRLLPQYNYCATSLSAETRQVSGKKKFSGTF